MDDLLLRALLAGLVLALMLGPLGAFVVWRQMAYFGDTIAHSALLGVALSLTTGGLVSIPVGIFLTATAVALILTRYARDQRFQADTVLGILAHSALAFGVLFVAMTRHVRVDMNAYLFGDILGVSWGELGLLSALSVVVIGLIALNWRGLLKATIEPSIAAVDGVNVARMQLLLTLLLSAVIAVAIKLTGVLLITALLIIPAAAARYLATSPKQMAVLASVVGMVSAASGLFISLHIDSPTGPTLVASAAILFVLCGFVRRRA
jgi:zinc transport system permease protein